MKRLKFRAWHKKREELLFGTAGTDGGLVFVKPTDMYADSREEIGYRDENLEILQFTGIEDISGREVYEGDIVTDGSLVESEVFYNSETGSFEPLNKIDHQKVKIVGTKYELKIG